MAGPTTVPLVDILDGAPPIGTHGTIAIPTGGTSFTVLEEKVTPTWSFIEDKTPTGAPNRGRWVKERYKIELTIQLPRASSVTYGGTYPIPGNVFVWTPANETAVLNFCVIETPEERNNGSSIETAKITAMQVIGSVTTT